MITSAKDVVRRTFELVSDNDFDALREQYDADCVMHDQNESMEIRGVDAQLEYLRQYTEAFPGMRIEVVDQISEGDLVATRWIARGRHDGTLLDIEPTGKDVAVNGIEFDRVRNGRIVETWQNWDVIGMFQQIGQMPSEAAIAR
jgi:steroid delta-isomerase-like uncharacterized protein